MSVSSHVNMKSIRSFEAVLLVWCLILLCTAGALLLMSSSKAHAFTHENLDEMGVKALSSTLNPSPSFSTSESSNIQGDACKYLLQAVHFDNPPSLRHAPQSVTAMDNDRRNVGKAAALGLMLGVRIAIAPPAKQKGSKVSSITPALWMQASNGNPAFAVTAYRDCKKKEALREKQNR